MITQIVVTALLSVASPDPLSALLGPSACDDPTGACLPKGLPAFGSGSEEWDQAVDKNLGGRNMYGLGGGMATRYTDLAAGKLAALEEFLTAARPVLQDLEMPTTSSGLSTWYWQNQVKGAPVGTTGNELRGDGTKGGYLRWSWLRGYGGAPKGGVFEVFSVSNLPREADSSALQRYEEKFLQRWPGAEAEPISSGRRIRLESPAQTGGVDLITIDGRPLVIKWVIANDGASALRLALRSHLRAAWLAKYKKQLAVDSDAEVIKAVLDAFEKLLPSRPTEVLESLDVVAFIEPANPRLTKLRADAKTKVDAKQQEADRAAQAMEAELQGRGAPMPDDDPRKLLYLLFGPPACAHVTRVCFKNPTYENPGKGLQLINAKGEIIPKAAFKGLRTDDYRAVYPQLGVEDEVNRLAEDLTPLLSTDEKLIASLSRAFREASPSEFRKAMSDHVWLNFADAIQGPVPPTGEDEDLTLMALTTATPETAAFDSPGRPLAHITSEYHKRGQNVEFDILLEKYLKQFRQAFGAMATESPLDQGGRLFTLNTPHETAYVGVTLTHEVYQTNGKVVPNSTHLVVVKSVFSRDALRTLRGSAVGVERTNWLQRRKQATGSATDAELFDYELAAARKLASTDPGKALANLATLAFFPEGNTEAALAIKRDALRALEARQRAEKTEADKRAAAELAAKAKRDAAARKAQAAAAARSKALLAGVNQNLTPEGALFDIDAARGQVAIWQGSLVKKLFGTTYLAATGGVFWCFRLEGGGAGQPGYFVAKGTVTGGCKVTDGIRELTVPQLAGTFVDLP